MRNKIVLLILGFLPFFPVNSQDLGHSHRSGIEQQKSIPKRNPYLSQAIYGVTHINSAQTNCVPFHLNDGNYKVDLNELTPIWGGPINNVTYA
ncbi:MAG: hypothetical protein ACRCZZ_05385, partial [Phocaeicola sp.]